MASASTLPIRFAQGLGRATWWHPFGDAGRLGPVRAVGDGPWNDNLCGGCVKWGGVYCILMYCDGWRMLRVACLGSRELEGDSVGVGVIVGVDVDLRVGVGVDVRVGVGVGAGVDVCVEVEVLVD